MINSHIFREYDIRGIVGTDINKEIAISIGKAFAAFVKEKNPDAISFSVGRDVRISSDELSQGIMDGIISTGLNVYDIGVCPTPLQYFSLHRLKVDGGVMVTGSHNPPEYNGFKISINKNTIYGSDIQRLKEIILHQKWHSSSKKGGKEEHDIIRDYKKYMIDEFSYLAFPEYKKIKVVVDAGNGTAGLLVPEILTKIGCEVVPLFCEPDGKFPNHHPDPTVVENIKDLIAAVKNTEADIGVGYDGDADRIGVVNKEGKIIWGDQIMIILCRDILKRTPGAKIVGDVKCSQNMFDDIMNHGGIPVMWKTGHSLIKEKMKQENALLAGEFSGHIFIRDRYYGYDDAIYTTLRLIEIMKTEGKSIRELLSGVPETHSTPEIRIDCPDDKKNEIVDKFVSKVTQYKANGNIPYRIIGLNTVDGVRVEFENGWGLLRSSNTQPVVVMRIEAGDKKSLDDYRAFFEKELKEASG